jgi:hypothetical protein
VEQKQKVKASGDMMPISTKQDPNQLGKAGVEEKEENMSAAQKQADFLKKLGKPAVGRRLYSL